MELEEAVEIAEAFLTKNDIAHNSLFNCEYTPKGTLHPGGVRITNDEWELCFIRRYKDVDVISTNAAVIVIVDVETKAARFLSS